MEKIDTGILSAYDEALEILDKFSNNPNTKLLQEASYKLLENISRNKRHAPSYFCLSYIFYALDNTEFAMKFMKAGEQLSPNVPEELQKLRNKILNDGARYKTFEFDANKQVSFSMPSKPTPKPVQAKTREESLSSLRMPTPVKVTVNKDSSFWKVMSK